MRRPRDVVIARLGANNTAFGEVQAGSHPRGRYIIAEVECYGQDFQWASRPEEVYTHPLLFDPLLRWPHGCEV